MVLLLNVCSYLNREHASCSEEHQLFYRASGILPSQCFTGFVLDKDDRSITRSDLYFKELFNQCGLHIWKIKVCSDFFHHHHHQLDFIKGGGGCWPIGALAIHWVSTRWNDMDDCDLGAWSQNSVAMDELNYCPYCWYGWMVFIGFVLAFTPL